MKRIFRKIHLRYQQIKKHPISGDNRVKALSRYIWFNIINNTQSEIKYKWIENLVFLASKGDGGIIGNIYYGLLEFDESMFLLHFLRDEDVFLDIGANVGHYSLLASGIKNCRSISIEPVPSTYEKLKKQIEINNLEDKIEASNIGVGNQRTNLYFSTDKSTMNRIVVKEYKNSVEIPVETIDEICENESVSIIKIDVEGYEKFVLEGSKKTLKSNCLKSVIIEINFSNEFYGVKNEEVSRILYDNGFFPYKYLPFYRKLVKLESYNKEQFNTIFIRDLPFVTERLDKSKRIIIWNKAI